MLGGTTAVGLALALAACASPLDDPTLYAAGWRPATVVALGPAETLISEDARLCIGAQPWQPGDPAAAVRFRSDDRFQLRRVTLVVPAPMAGPVDGTAWVNLRTCRLQAGPPSLAPAPTPGS